MDVVIVNGGELHIGEAWRNQLSKATKRAGVSYSSQELRHVAASLWVKSGASNYLVMKAGGWSSLDMVSKVYGHLWPSGITELGRRMDALDWDNLD